MSFVDELFSLKGKVAIVTGASNGIGFAIASGFSKASAKVYGVARSKKPKREYNFNYISCDVSNIEKIEKIIKGIIAENSKIDILVNAAGITIDGDFNNFKKFSESLHKTLEINLKAPVQIIKLASELMKANGGSIINITSIAAHFGFPDNPSYVASKGALKMATKAFAEDLAKYNIRVNNIAPGYIHTDMTDRSYRDKEKYEIRLRNTMLKRWGKPEDIIGAAIFLASDASSYITGADIMVDGGWSAKGLV